MRYTLKLRAYSFTISGVAIIDNRSRRELSEVLINNTDKILWTL